MKTASLVAQLEKAMALQYPCLANLMEERAWWAAVHGVAKSQDMIK